jgi:hypothetical protein
MHRVAINRIIDKKCRILPFCRIADLRSQHSGSLELLDTSIHAGVRLQYYLSYFNCGVA